MGPTNVALVNLFHADQDLRNAQAKLDEAGKNVRVQERRVHDLEQKLKDAHQRLRQHQAHAGAMDVDLRSRDAHIEKLRTQQQTAKNNKEYQAFLVEINTHKVDRGKVEDEAVRTMGEVEKGQAEVAALSQQLEGERAKLATLKSQGGEVLARLQAEVDALRPARDAAAAKVPAKYVDAFTRLADRYDGQAMSKLDRPDRRREEYLCTECNMELAIDVYNKLRTRDEVVFCPSCRRILYIPEALTPEAAIIAKGARGGATRTKVSGKRGKGGAEGGDGTADAGEAGSQPVTIEQRAKGRLGQILSSAQGESVHAAVVSGSNPVEFQVFINGELAGFYKGKDAGHLERNIRYRLSEAKLNMELRVQPVAEESAAVGETAAGEADAGSPPVADESGSAEEPSTKS
jgi:predicted  nucleic acid-binding Zn-ribbon protein